MSVRPSDLTFVPGLLEELFPLIFPVRRLSDFIVKIEQSTEGGKVLKAVE